MEKNYYKILEVDKSACQEIIDKAYKTLVKKYHPDLQNYNYKEQCEEKLKLLNEAYTVLSDPEKRNSYDLNYNLKEVNSESYDILFKENITLKKQISYLNSEINYLRHSIDYSNISNKSNYYASKSNNGNTVFSKTNFSKRSNLSEIFNNFLTTLICLSLTILIMIIMIIILWNIPFTKNYIIKNFFIFNH